MNVLKSIQAIIVLVCLLSLTYACKQDTTSESVKDNTISGDSTYKKAEFIEPLDFQKGMNRSRAVIVDVRMPQEFEQGHIEGAVNINFFDPNFKSQLLGLEKNKKYYMYCKNGRMSERAAEFMMKNDYSEIYVLKGGYEAWQEAALQ